MMNLFLSGSRGQGNSRAAFILPIVASCIFQKKKKKKKKKTSPPYEVTLWRNAQTLRLVPWSGMPLVQTWLLTITKSEISILEFLLDIT